jgi:hypothetical protein
LENQAAHHCSIGLVIRQKIYEKGRGLWFSVGGDRSVGTEDIITKKVN